MYVVLKCSLVLYCCIKKVLICVAMVTTTRPAAYSTACDYQSINQSINQEFLKWPRSYCKVH